VERDGVRAVWRGAWVIAVAGALLAARGSAQRRAAAAGLDPARLGPHIGYNFDAEALTLGAQVTLPITRQIGVYPSFDYYFVDPGTLWALNADVKFRPLTQAGALYVGGGLNYLHTSAGGGHGDTNLNLLGGLEARWRPSAPFIEARLILGDGSAFQVVAGVNFRLH
jgi:hypothetical protein